MELRSRQLKLRRNGQNGQAKGIPIPPATFVGKYQQAPKKQFKINTM